ncbi:hypothetical protein ACP70R_006209 [Stipagrostis hirtigluma subsp. patula]
MARLPLVVAVAACCALLAVSAPSPPPAVYHVGDDRGWAVPSQSGNDTAVTYVLRPVGHGAAVRRRRHVDFKHTNDDSVLLVRRGGYERCGTASPAARRLADGAGAGGTRLRFTLDRPGIFYFISGAPGHCAAGQRMAVRVAAISSSSSAMAAAAPLPAQATPPPCPGTPPAGDYVVVIKMTRDDALCAGALCVCVLLIVLFYATICRV